MRMIHSTYSTVHHYSRVSQDDFTLAEAVRTYFAILFGVGVLVLSYYYMIPRMH